MHTHNSKNGHTPPVQPSRAREYTPQAPVCEAINTYITAVCQQIRWKKARAPIADELTNHISDTRDAYVAKGLPSHEATIAAIADTGDAEIIGTQLDRVHHPKPQWGMLSTTAVLVMLGLAIYAYFAGGLSAERLIFTAVGVAALVAAYYIDFTWLAKYPKTMLFAVIAGVLVLLYLRSYGIHPSNLVNLWGDHSLQSGMRFFSMGDVLTLIFPLVLAIIIFYAKGRGYWGLVITGLSFTLLTVVAIGMSVVGTARFMFIGFVLISVAIAKGVYGIRKLHAALLTFGPVVLSGFLVFASMHEYQRQRFAVIFSPSSAAYGSGFMAILSRDVLSEAAWFGQGTTDALGRLLPFYPTSPIRVDAAMALTVLIGLMGWVVFVVIVGALAFFIAKGTIRCVGQKSSLGLLVSSAVMLTFAVQTVEYVTFNLGFHIASPISLPLIISSNAAFIVNMAMVGFMLSVFRTGDAVQDRHYEYSRSRFVRWDNGRLIFDFKYGLQE